MSSLSLSKLKKRSPTQTAEKPKKKIGRFDGLTEEEVQKNTLPDILEMNLDMVFVGINPSLMAAHRGRYYAGPGNHFYKLLHESGLTPRFVSFEEDSKLLEYSIGLTNIVSRATRSQSDLKRSEIKEGASIVREKLKTFKPKIAIFNGKGIYEIYADISSKSAFHFGLQTERVDETAIWVVPSSSARCSHFPRMTDKLRFYVALKKYLLHLKGELEDVDAAEFKFDGKCKPSVPMTSKMWRRKNMSAFLHGGRVANKDTFSLDTSEESVARVNSTEFIVEKREEIAVSVSSDVEIERVTNKDAQVAGEEGDPGPRGRKRTTRTSVKVQRTERVLRPRERGGDSADFVELIKQRLSQKKNGEEKDSTVMGENKLIISKSNGDKRLNYSSLRSIERRPKIGSTTDHVAEQNSADD